jgi:hypothetical protein
MTVTPRTYPHPFPPQALKIFVELERLPASHEVFTERRGRSEKLAILLGLEVEWLVSRCHVHNRERAPCWPEHMPACADWYKTQAIRELLIEATKGGAAPA